MEQAQLQQKRELVDYLIEKGVLVDNEMVELLKDENDVDALMQRLKSAEQSRGFLDEEMVMKILRAEPVVQEAPPQPAAQTSQEATQTEESTAAPEKITLPPRRISGLRTSARIIQSCEKPGSKKTVQDFVGAFRNRLKTMERILRGRRELGSKVTSIQKVIGKKDKEEIGIIGLVTSKSETKNGNLILTLEDMTGEFKVLINKTKTDMFNQAQEINLDEVIGVVGIPAETILFVNSLIFPDIPMGKPFKKSPDEVYAVFISDLHTGSQNFLYKEFTKFIKWINGEVGNEAQKQMAKKIGYLIIAGDLVDGVGIYPGQDEELDILDITKQYELVAQYLAKVPPHIQIVCIPGNHDACRLAEPQLAFYKDFAKSIYDLPNVTVGSNPSTIRIHESEDFEGFDILLYHGYSFIYYGDKVDSIRASGGIDRPDLLMKCLLQKRHLAPAQGSAPYIADPEIDHQIIEQVPDFIVTGHIHKASISQYRNVTMICGSCWQSITSFEEKMGLNPEPGRVPIVNLQTRECKIVKFTDEE